MRPAVKKFPRGMRIVVRSLRTEYFKKDIDSHWHTLLLACVPQFDTMHPSMTLGANFNDSNIHIRPK